MPKFITSYLTRLSALIDKSALFLIIPCALALYFIDAPMFTTMMQWLVVAPIIAGVAVMVSRIIFPQVKLTELILEAHTGNKAAGIVAGALIIFVGILLLALVTWAKA